MDFQGKHVVITGADGALGNAVTAWFLERGATLHVPLRGVNKLAPHVRVSVKEHVDLVDEAAVTAFYGALPTLWGSIHLAGGFAMSPVVDTPLATVRVQWDINFVTAFLCSREAARNMQRGTDGGRIINVGARPAVTHGAGMAAYAASKAALCNFTVSLAEELKPHRILCNAVLPSTMDTPAARAGMPDADFSRWPKTTEVAETIGFLASPLNAITSGALVPVFGRA